MKNLIPKAYRRSSKTKLLWLYKLGLVSRDRFEIAIKKAV